MPLSPRRKVTTPVDMHNGETVLDARTPEVVSLITKNLGIPSEAVAERHDPKGTAA